MMTRRLAALVAVMVVVATACAGGSDQPDGSQETSQTATSGSTAAPEESATPAVTASGDPDAPILVTADNLDEAFTAANLDCDLIRASTSCYFDEVPMPVIVPFDWDVDVEERVEACEEGYIASDYEVVGDGATWYAAPNEPTYGEQMIDALEGAGYQATWQPYCPS